jgi:1,4-alpha-glucan branching enzyme
MPMTGGKGATMPQRSDRPGFGAVPYPGGVTFRVWAPNATAVTVYRPAAQNQPESLLGDLAAESNGSWSADVSGLQPGDEYGYRITGPSGQLSRLDPCARQVTNSVGNVVIYDPDRFVWTDTGYQAPGWDELVIYELHVGTFNELPGDTVGTLADAAQKLPYLARLGVRARAIITSPWPGVSLRRAVPLGWCSSSCRGTRGAGGAGPRRPSCPCRGS